MLNAHPHILVLEGLFLLLSPAAGEVHRHNRDYIEVKVLMTTTGTTTATTMIQVSTPELEDEVVSVASPPLVVTEEDTTLSPAMELELERREFRVLDWVWEVDVPGWLRCLPTRLQLLIQTRYCRVKQPRSPDRRHCQFVKRLCCKLRRTQFRQPGR